MLTVSVIAMKYQNTGVKKIGDLSKVKVIL